MFFILNMLPDNMQCISFLVKQASRSKFTSTAIYATVDGNVNRHSNEVKGGSSRGMSSSLSSNHLHQTSLDGADAHHHLVFSGNGAMATPSQWMKGFWNHFLTITEGVSFQTSSELRFHAKWRFKEIHRASPIRELSYDMVVSREL